MKKEMITIKMFEDNNVNAEILQLADLSKIVGGITEDKSKQVLVDADGPYIKK